MQRDFFFFGQGGGVGKEGRGDLWYVYANYKFTSATCRKKSKHLHLRIYVCRCNLEAEINTPKKGGNIHVDLYDQLLYMVHTTP